MATEWKRLEDLDVITHDRDEWKRRALKAEAELEKVTEREQQDPEFDPKIQMTDAEYHNRCDNTPWCRCGNGKCK